MHFVEKIEFCYWWLWFMLGSSTPTGDTVTRIWCKMTAWLSSSFWCMVSVPLLRNPSTYSLISKTAEIVFFISTLFVGTRISSIFRVGTNGLEIWKALDFRFLVRRTSETPTSNVMTQFVSKTGTPKGAWASYKKHDTRSRYAKKWW